MEDNQHSDEPSRPSAAPRTGLPSNPPEVRFSEISQGNSEVIIVHDGQKYLLRATRNGRLLLNK